MPIGVFDSGFGGLSVLHYINQQLPTFDLVYLGDSARAPYGSRSSAEIYHYVEQAVTYLMVDRNCNLVILACNSASADALRRLQQEWLPRHFPNRRVLGVLIPVAEHAVSISPGGKIGVLATTATITSGAYIREITKLRPSAKIFQVACPLFVPLIEAGEDKSLAMDYFIKKYISTNSALQDIDTLILGCTHYGLIADQIYQVVAPNIQIIAGGQIVAIRLSEYLQRHPDITSLISRQSQRTFLTTGQSSDFALHGERFYGQSFVAEHVRLN